MSNLELITERKLKTQLRKAENREKIAECKLDRLKSRFDRMYDEMAELEGALQQSHDQVRELENRLTATECEKSRMEQESAMWRAQLFERMEILDKTRAKLEASERALSDMQQKAEVATRTHQTDHEELKRRDRERHAFQLQIEELQSAHKESRNQTEDLLSALTDAEQAIASLQRSNDFHQREIEGLKAIGASLTEQLSNVTQQRDRYKERLTSRGDELRLEQAESAHLLSEVERLKNELYEVKGKLLTYQIEADVREIRKTGQDKASHAQGEKYGDFPSAESAVAQPRSRTFLSKATKKVSGWFRLSDEISRN